MSSGPIRWQDHPTSVLRPQTPRVGIRNSGDWADRSRKQGGRTIRARFQLGWAIRIHLRILGPNFALFSGIWEFVPPFFFFWTEPLFLLAKKQWALAYLYFSSPAAGLGGKPSDLHCGLTKMPQLTNHCLNDAHTWGVALPLVVCSSFMSLEGWLVVSSWCRTDFNMARTIRK